MQENTPSQQEQVQTPLSYVPGSTEKKKCVMMYLLLGIILGMSKTDMSRFEYFHFKQSIGWWILFMIILLVAIILVLLPRIWFVWWLVILAMLVIVWLFIKQAREGKYQDTIEMTTLPLFIGVWWWVLQMFDIHIHTEIDNNTPIENKTTTNNGTITDNNTWTEKNTETGENTTKKK